MNETQNSASQSDINTYIDNWWLVWLGVISLGLSASTCVLSIVGARIDHQEVIYPLVTNISGLALTSFGLASVCSVPWVFLMALFAVFDCRMKRCYRQSLLTLVCTVVGAIFIVISFSLFFASRILTHIETVQFNNHIYNLASFHEYDDLAINYLLYNCSEGLYCQLVHQYQGYSYDGNPVAGLQADTDANMLSIIVEDEILYTCTP